MSLTLYLLNKETALGRNLITETYYVSTDEQTVIDAYNSLIDNTGFSVVEYISTEELFPLSINGTIVSNSTSSFLNSPFLFDTQPNPVKINELNASQFASSLMIELNASSVPLPSVKLADEIVNHPFVIALFAGFSNEFYDYGEVGFKALLPIPFVDLKQFILDTVNFDKINQLKGEMNYFQNFARNILYKYELKRLTDNASLTYTQFLDDVDVQAEITAEFQVDLAQIPLILEIYATYHPIIN